MEPLPQKMLYCAQNRVFCIITRFNKAYLLSLYKINFLTRGSDNQRTNGPVNAHLISWSSKAQNIQNLENIWYVSIEGQGHFLTLAPGRVHTKIKTGFSQKLLCRSEVFFHESFLVQGNENLMT